MCLDNISPTIEGPLCAVKKVGQAGKFGHNKSVGGKARVHGHMLAKKDGSGQTGNVPVCQNQRRWGCYNTDDC
jgi:hypothetical protein